MTDLSKDTRWNKLEISLVLLAGWLLAIVFGLAWLHGSDVLAVLIAALCVAPWGWR